MSLKKSFLIILLILIVDQWSKIYIKTHFTLRESITVFSWFKILFVENKGMAWGVELPGNYGKLSLTLFRLVAISGIGYWLWDSTRKKEHPILLVSIAFIFAGALGNIIDSVWYGLIFSKSTMTQIATLFPEVGYEKLFYGRVVDMIQLPMIDTILPNWIPFGYGGQRFTFFDPVFNIADSAISIGVGLLILFNKTVFPNK